MNAPLVVVNDLTNAVGNFDMNGKNITISGNWLMPDGTLVAGTNTVTFNGAGIQSLDAGGQSFYNVTHSGSGTLKLVNASLGMAHDFNNIAGIFDLNAENVSIGGNWTISGGSYIPGTSTVTFNGAGTQVMDAANLTFYDLTHSGSGTLKLANALLTVTHRFSNAAGTFELNGKSWQMTGAILYNAGTVTLYGNEAISGLVQEAAAGTWHYLGDGVQHTYVLINCDYYNLVIDGTDPSLDIFQLPNALTVRHDLSILSGQLDSRSFDIHVGGQWNDQGSFNAGTGTVIFDGKDQAILGSSTFYNLIKEVTQPDTLILGAGQTQVVRGDLTLHGSLSGELRLRSSIAGVQWAIDPQGERYTSFLDVQDGHNVSGSVINCLVDCVDSGNNNGFLIFGLSFDPFVNSSLNYFQASGTGHMVPFNSLYRSALSNSFNSVDGSWNAISTVTVNGTMTITNETYNANGLTMASGSTYQASTATQIFNGYMYSSLEDFFRYEKKKNMYVWKNIPPVNSSGVPLPRPPVSIPGVPVAPVIPVHM